MSRITIPIGPQHPLLKEPLSLVLEAIGERIVSASMRIGYVHRGIELLCQRRTYVQNVHLFERVCGICSQVHTTAYCQAVEALLGLEIPPRAAYIRVLMCELERIHSHLLWLGVLAEAIGFTTIFMYAWRDREIVLDLMEELSGGRVSHSANIIGGVRIGVSSEQARLLEGQLATFAEQMEFFRELLDRDRSFHRRTQNVGYMSLEMVHSYGVVGPAARSSGCTVDVRRAAPYAAYPSLAFEVISASEGDVWSRAQVRLMEIMQSLSICNQVIEALPGGPLAVGAPRRVPPGEVVTRCEAPRGELIYYVRSDGSERPARIKVRTPTLPMLMVISHLLPGLETADVAAVMAGADLCVACADR
ncbi:MAG TPA: nickel-dependent hydrogenase large subunit [Anaerolineae bacterium]|nr:nickel-dependent hydrogenase large subunit [Anaerolineae bacterium]